MLKILLIGALGKMGRSVMSCVEEIEDTYVVAGIDRHAEIENFGVIKIFNRPEKVEEKFNVILDFSHASALNEVLKFAVEARKPLVIATTGHSIDDESQILKASKYIPIFKSANMSVGVSAMCELVKLSKKLLPDFDIAIVETHHNQKVDAPSGTAIMLNKAVKEVESNSEIEMLSIRGGNVVGEHEVNFYGNDETIKICHTAQSKSIFSNGAVNACKFIQDKKPGLYSMQDLLGLESVKK